MNIDNILSFLNAVAANNNRPWFAENKAWFEECKADFEAFSQLYLERMQDIDTRLQGLTLKDCVYRFYRDIRFSPDKSPYKDHFGTILAPYGGRKSLNGCYYLHIQPGNIMFCAGVWCPDSKLTKMLRQSCYDNEDELADIMSNPDFATAFGGFDDFDTTKVMPSGFPKDFAHPEWLKRRSFTTTHHFTLNEVKRPDFIDELVRVATIAMPLNIFLDYTVDEYNER